MRKSSLLTGSEQNCNITNTPNFTNYETKTKSNLTATVTTLANVSIIHQFLSIGGHKPTGHNPLGQNPPFRGKAGRKPQDITPCRIRTQCMMSFSVTRKGVLKAKFQDWRT